MNWTPTHTNIAWRVALCALLAVLVLSPDAAWATTSGGGLPYETGLTSIGNSTKGIVAFVLILIGMAGGVAQYMTGGELTGILMVAARAGMAFGLIGGVIAFATLMGMTGAVV